ncbi:MAG TPA: Gfo/Idh/MocA family oxidoreductase [Candidatus Acidoferrales bacterium]|nr:Gfo/Idh/MocA family oxidoreductase [Candidatus Acidoferrales bacterium]
MVLRGNDSRKSRLLIIGCGSIGQRHAKVLRELGVEDVLLFDTDEKRAESLGRELQMEEFHTLEDAFKAEPDAAVICAPTGLHLELAFEALRHNCHLFIEKPISHSTDGVADLLHEVAEKERLLLAGYNFRFDPLLNTAKQWLNEKRIGTVTGARLHFGSYLPWRHPLEDYRAGYGACKSLGGGVILDAIHEIDIALWFFGWPDSIYSAGGKYSDLEIDVEDTAEITITYADKVVSVHLDFVQRPAERWFEVTGTGGRIAGNLFARSLRWFDGVSQKWFSTDIGTTIEDTYRSEMRHFLDCLEGKDTPLIDGETAVQSLILAEEAKQSMQWRLPISLSGLDLWEEAIGRTVSRR